MNKISRILLAVCVGILLLGIISTGQIRKRKAAGATPAPVVTSSTDIADESTPAPVPTKEYNTVDSVSDSVMNPLKRDAEKAMECTRETYASLDKGTAVNVVLSNSSVAQLVYTLGENGYSAIDYFGNVDMQNPQNLIDFGNAVNAGQDAQAAYYVVHPDGRMHANILSYKDGEGSVITISEEWDKDMKPRIYSTGRYYLSEIRYTDKGWLICNRDMSGLGKDDKISRSNSYTFVRLLPYAEDKRALSDRFLGPAAYSENNLFTCTWNAADYGQLDFNCIFPMLYGEYYGSDPLINSNMRSIAGYKSVSGTDMHIVPYEQFERVIGHYFDISAETLRHKADNSSSYGGYFILGAQTSYSSTSKNAPEPEIVDYWYNGDGSLTMKVDAVYPWYGTDCAFTHELTIMETKDGFKYVSNYLYESPDNIFPELSLKKERAVQISLLD